MQTPPPGETPPPYAAYPRQHVTTYGSPDQLWALWEGYTGLNKVFVVNIILVLASNAGARAANTGESVLMLFFGAATVIGLVVGFATYPFNKKIAYGANWDRSMGVLASVLMGLNSALCCGIIGYVVMQQIATNHMRRYGLKPSLFGGIKKGDVEAVVNQMRAQAAAAPMYPPAQ